LKELFETENRPLGDGLRHLILKTVAMSLIRKARTRFTYELFFVFGCLYAAGVLRPNKSWICFGRVGLPATARRIYAEMDAPPFFT